MASGVKRKHRSCNDKLNILKQYDNRCPGERQKEVADKLSLPKTTLFDIIKKREEIEANAVQSGSRRIKFKVSKFDELENILLEWFQEARTNNFQVNGPIVTEKALEIAKKKKNVRFYWLKWLD